MLFCSMFFGLCVQVEYLLMVALYSLEVSNRTTPVDSKYVSRPVSFFRFPFSFLILSHLLS
jgi:hypothetical protein